MTAADSGTRARNSRCEYTRADGAAIHGTTDGGDWATLKKGAGTNGRNVHSLGKAHGGEA